MMIFFLSINNDNFNKYITNIMNFDDVSIIVFYEPSDIYFNRKWTKWYFKERVLLKTWMLFFFLRN